MKKTAVYGLGLICLWIVLLVMPFTVSAHTDNSEGYSEVTVDENNLKYELYLDYFELARVVEFEVKRGDPADKLRTALEKNVSGLSEYLASHLSIYADGGALLEGEIVMTDVERKNNREYAHITLNYHASGLKSSSILIQYNVFFDDNDPMHRNIMTYGTGSEQEQFIFNMDERENKIGNSTIFGQIVRFLELGFHHILIGTDHILFIVAIILGARKIGDIVKVATVFTLAHSVTLGLTALNVISIPPEIVEPLIALSIAYVAIETILFPNSKYRLLVVFIFGLFHGMGFAGVLQLTGGVTWKTLLSILSFNGGVEIGQILIILLLFPVLLFIRRYRWNIAIQGAVTAGIFVFGLVWYIQRMIG
ncbi:HupE/UreJ family protein [Sporosarcina globispora]|uniref:HupE/UreJ family protein n=1 Tax=Sporosarcina globispora TaxID=1459 RepID=UPI00128F53B7|nr:HupE/UreJ family protein [Sporosarcina globispora]